MFHVAKLLLGISIIAFSFDDAVSVDAADLSLSNLASFSVPLPNPPNCHAGLIRASDGSLYGTTSQGGANGGYGTIFRFNSASGLSTITSFGGTNGAKPYCALLQGTDGYLYGTTTAGGNYNLGTIFSVSTNGNLITLASFNGTNGAVPYSALVQDQGGILYGTTTAGGISNKGTVFSVTTNGNLITIASFTNLNGATPASPLLLAADGLLYGTTFVGGTNGGWGTIFKVSINGGFTSLYSFEGTNGALPYSGLCQDQFGALYGTTTFGGSGFDGSLESGSGTIFRISTNGVFSDLYMFSASGIDGQIPSWGSLVLTSDGLLYGVTYQGGMYGWGTAFQVTTNGVFNSLFSFNFDQNGYAPYGALLPDKFNTFYGTTSGATGSAGTIFKLSPASPVLIADSLTGSKFAGNCNTLIGHSYQLQYRTNLNQGSWNNAGVPYLATNSTTSFSDANLSDPERFYRVNLILNP